MKRLLRRRPSPGLVIACIALFVALGPAAYGTHLGALLLGHTNTVNSAATSLSGSNNGKMLQVTNNGTGTAATALGLNVAADKPPLMVNSGTKVANLNVDRLDGLDSAAFARGAIASYRKIIAVGTSRSAFFSVGGLVDVAASCGETFATLRFTNTSGVTVDFVTNSPNIFPKYLQMSPGREIGFDVEGLITVQVGKTTNRIVTTVASMTFGVQEASPCSFQAQVVVR